MSRKTKIWLIVAGSLILVGAIIFTGVMSAMEWDFSRLSTEKYETNEYEISEAFESISLKTDTADIIFLPSSDDACRVECYESKKEKHSVEVKDGALEISLISEKQWYDYIQINLYASPKIKIYLPKSEFKDLTLKGSTTDIEISKGLCFENINVEVGTGDVRCYASASNTLKIKANTGDVYVEGASAGNVDLTTNTGDITVSKLDCDGSVSLSVNTGKSTLSSVKCKDLVSVGNTGDIILTDVVSSGRLDITRGTGDVRFDGCDANEITLKASTGDVRGSLLSDKIFITKAGTGKISVPETTSGGVCRITTTTGDIKITIKQ